MADSMKLEAKLCAVQSEFIIGKNKHNTFGNFNYRNVEDMLATLKPILRKYNLILTFCESIVAVEGRVYVISDATIYDADSGRSFMARAYAREPEDKKGMDASQITGSTTSYARKSALAGLLAVDNGERDPDQDDDKNDETSDKPDDIDPKKLELLNKIRKIDPNAPAKMLKVQNVHSFDELPVEYFERVLAAYEKKTAQKEAKNG